MNKEVRVRFAPSPTGMLHLGGLRTALYDFLYARKNKGKFILRIEDTDQSRYVEGAVENLVSTLQDLGLDFDEGPVKGGPYGPYFQSQRLDIYRKYINELIEKGYAYYCFCSKETLEEMKAAQTAQKQTSKYDGRCKMLSKEEIDSKLAAGDSYVVRLKMPVNHTFAFEDHIRGMVEISSEQVDDQVLLKSDGFPTYHLAAVVDDHLMEITHVIRGEEWLSSTPKHVYLYEAFGWTPPAWIHLPLLLNTDRSKLSKRHGDFSVKTYLEKGFPKEAILNFVALLGWHPVEDREIISLPEMLEEFSFERVNKSGAIFDITKLDWMSGMYMRNLDINIIAHEAEPFFHKAGLDTSDRRKFLKALQRARDQVSSFNNITEHAYMFYNDLTFSPEDLELLKQESSIKVIDYFICKLNNMDSIDKDELTHLVKQAQEELGVKGKNFFFPLRLAMFGNGHGPDIPTLIDILGKDDALKRLKTAHQLSGNN